MERFLFVLTLAAAIGSGLVAGIFYAFSSFVMPALARLTAEAGLTAMQMINRTVITPSFMLAFLGTGVLCLAIMVISFTSKAGMGAALPIAACLIYLLGSFGVTMMLNVPLNNALASTDPASPESIEFWSGFVRDWVKWNHVRTLASLVSSTLFMLALSKSVVP